MNWPHQRNIKITNNFFLTGDKVKLVNEPSIVYLLVNEWDDCFLCFIAHLYIKPDKIEKATNQTNKKKTKAVFMFTLRKCQIYSVSVMLIMSYFPVKI